MHTNPDSGGTKQRHMPLLIRLPASHSNRQTEESSNAHALASECLTDGGADVHIPSPLRRVAVVAPIFVDGYNRIVFCPYKGSDMK